MAADDMAMQSAIASAAIVLIPWNIPVAAPGGLTLYAWCVRKWVYAYK